MSPASTHYFYFVARGDGRSTFSETYEAHAGAVKDLVVTGNGTSVAPGARHSSPSPTISREEP